MGKTNHFDLNGGIPIGLDATRRVPQCPSRDIGVNVLINLAIVHGEMRIGPVRGEGTEGACRT
jgi:hypothetical protein